MPSNDVRHKESADDFPLFHTARFELANAALNGELDEFRSLIRNELPFETFMELAEYYESIGCID